MSGPTLTATSIVGLTPKQLERMAVDTFNDGVHELMKKHGLTRIEARRQMAIAFDEFSERMYCGAAPGGSNGMS